MALQSWSEHEENFDRLLAKLDDKESGLTPWIAMHRWRRRFWWLLTLGSILVVYLLVALAEKQ